MTYAVVRINELDPVLAAASPDQLARFEEAHAAQPGFRGTITVDLGARRLVLNLWTDQASAQAALSTLRPVIGELLEPLMAAPSEFLGAGTVTLSGTAEITDRLSELS